MKVNHERVIIDFRNWMYWCAEEDYLFEIDRSAYSQQYSERTFLAGRNLLKSDQTQTQLSGYVQDRRGDRFPVWQVRAGDVLSDASLGSRRIVSTSYDCSTGQITLQLASV